jgi:hypothetical protein
MVSRPFAMEVEIFLQKRTMNATIVMGCFLISNFVININGRGVVVFIRHGLHLQGIGDAVFLMCNIVPFLHYGML